MQLSLMKKIAIALAFAICSALGMPAAAEDSKNLRKFYYPNAEDYCFATEVCLVR